ncbi:MAG TPA: response regulator [Candidatus Binatia bacterium]|nr:response regulator [Candidatus Binatia bacterium]
MTLTAAAVSAPGPREGGPARPLLPDAVSILLVDDQPGKLLTYESILSGLGERLVKASSGDEALQQLLKTEFAVVLLDVCMPNIDGFELARLIREHPRCQRTAIIFISAVQITNLDQLKGYESGAVDYISVPVIPEVLRARVQVFCDLHRKTAALERMNRDLEQRVAERTAELERDLAERKRLEEALRQTDRRKDEFLATLAHELRNPLAPIRTAVDIMRLKPVQDPVLLDCRDVIGRQMEQLTRLVDDLLDISRITRGSIRLERRTLDVATVVTRAVETHRPAIDARRQTLTVELPSESLTVNGDLTRLAESLGNLLSNAAKYTDEGGRIALRVTREASQAVIRVSDNGLGIPAEMLPKVFDMFTQVDQTLHRSQGGLGIGLALVRKLMEMHGGSVEGHSDGLGRGSEFALRLPLREDGARPEVPQDNVIPISTSRRILVVDDNRDAGETLAVMLRLHGGQVEVAHSGAEALQMAERARPDLVLLDLGMPGMSGYEVARRLREQPWGRELMLVAQTGWGQDQDRRRTREAGFDEHLTKPVDHATLIRLMASPRFRDDALAKLGLRA